MARPHTRRRVGNNGMRVSRRSIGSRLVAINAAVATNWAKADSSPHDDYSGRIHELDRGRKRLAGPHRATSRPASLRRAMSSLATTPQRWGVENPRTNRISVGTAGRPPYRRTFAEMFTRTRDVVRSLAGNGDHSADAGTGAP
jgi:hypothetical protein